MIDDNELKIIAISFKCSVPTPGVLLLLFRTFMLLMWLTLLMWLGLTGPAVMLGVPLQVRSWSRSPRESRHKSGLLPTRHRLGLGLLESRDPCLSDAASSSLSMLRLKSCSFSEEASFSLNKNTYTFKFDLF